MLISEYDYEKIKIRKEIQEKVDCLPLPLDIKEIMFNILYKECTFMLESLPFDQKFLRQRKFVEYDWDYRKPLLL